MNGENENVDISQVNDYTPTSAQSYEDYVKANYSKTGNMPIGGTHSVFGDIANFFSGERDKYESEYNTYLQNLNAENASKAAELAYKRELQATQDARAWDKYLSDTQYQRAVKDLKAAGLNPWLALQSGVSGSSVPNSGKASASVGKSSQYERNQKQKSNSLRDVSLLLFALARLAG